MKTLWEELFYDMDECGWDRETFSSFVGGVIREELHRIERAIKDHDGKKALALIEDMKRDY